jgi:hypothetical protein
MAKRHPYEVVLGRHKENKKMSTSGDVFECWRDVIEVTSDGLFGWPADTNRVYLPGLLHCHINGTPVSQEEFERRHREQVPDDSH